MKTYSTGAATAAQELLACVDQGRVLILALKPQKRRAQPDGAIFTPEYNLNATIGVRCE
jgi:hypothetical protein